MHAGLDPSSVALFTVLVLSSCGGESVFGIGTGDGGVGESSGTGGTAGALSYGCDLNEALPKSCGRTGCHNATAAFAGLVLVTPDVGPTLVDKPAGFADIDCAVPFEPFRPCTPSELPSGCPPGALLIDSQNPEASWMLRKLDASFVAGSCGAPMPAPPGNAVHNGWSEERRACIQAWISSLASAR